MNPDPMKSNQIMNQKSYTENCVPDEDVMKYKPVRMTFFHYDRSTSKRKLLWHDGDAKTGVSDIYIYFLCRVFESILISIKPNH